MTVIHLLGGPRDGTTITTSDRSPKDVWFFEYDHEIHVYHLMRYADIDGNLWWVAQHEGLDNDQAEHLFTEHFYVPSRRIQPRRSRVARKPH